VLHGVADVLVHYSLAPPHMPRSMRLMYGMYYMVRAVVRCPLAVTSIANNTFIDHHWCPLGKQSNEKLP
jgi:hypothetical protein